jgi:hypothetical protein
MRDIFCDSIRLLLDQQEKCSTDDHGFVQGIHVSWFDNLRIEYEHHCRKHRVKKKKAHRQAAVKP